MYKFPRCLDKINVSKIIIINSLKLKDKLRCFVSV